MNITALLLAGGQSERMGQDKRLLKFQGKPLIRRALEAAQTMSDEVWALIASPRDEKTLAPVLKDRVRFFCDLHPNAGPLAALVSALPHVKSGYALLLAVDYPLVTGPFLQRMQRALEAESTPPDAFIPLRQGTPQVACAFYRQNLHQELQAAFEKGERSLRRWVMALPEGRVTWLLEEEYTNWGYPHVFLNVNTPQDYERLLRLRSS